MEGSIGTEILGYSAALLTTYAAIPQIYRALRNHSTEDLSLAMLITLSSGLGCWTVYGLIIKAWPIIVANGISCALNLSLIAMKLRFQKAPPNKAAFASRNDAPSRSAFSDP